MHHNLLYATSCNFVAIFMSGMCVSSYTSFVCKDVIQALCTFEQNTGQYVQADSSNMVWIILEEEASNQIYWGNIKSAIFNVH